MLCFGHVRRVRSRQQMLARLVFLGSKFKVSVKNCIALWQPLAIYA